jgi:hypothetical protein
VIDGLPPISVDRLFPSDHLAAGSGLPPLDARAVRAYLIEEMERRRYELLAAEDERGDSAFLGALTDRSRSLPLYFRMLVEDLRQNRFDLDDPGALPATLDAYYHELIDRLAMDAARGVLPAIIALLAMAEAPLSDAMLRSLLAGHHLAGSPEWSAVVEHALRIGHVMMRDSWLGDDRTGYALHHETFREYLRARERVSYSDCRMAPELQAARARLLDLCVEWSDWGATTDEGRYIRRHGAVHLAESERWSALDAALDDPSWNLLRRWTELGDAKQGIQCLPGLIAFHDRRTDGRGRAALLATQLGRLLTHTGDRAGSREWLEFAIARAAGESADRSWVIATHELGSLDFYEGDLTAAAARYRLALERARSARPELPGEVAANLLALATIEVLAHRPATALELATEAQHLAERGRDTAHLCAAYRVSASALKETCQYALAGERIEKALALSMLAGLPAEEAASAMSGAWLRYHMAVPEDLAMLAEAAALADAACRQARANSRILLLAAAQVCSATIALARQLPAQAEEAQHWLDRMSEDRIPYDLRVDRLLLRAKILHASAGAQAAEQAYREAGAAAAAVHMKARQADATVGLGTACFWQQRRSLARDAWAEAVAIAQSTSPHRYRLTRLSIEAARRAPDVPPY